MSVKRRRQELGGIRPKIGRTLRASSRIGLYAPASLATVLQMKTTTRLRVTALAALLVLAVSACGSEVTGSPAGPSYSPPDPATATAQPIDLEEALAVSPDGLQIAVTQDGTFCVRLRVPTGAKGTSATCADDAQISGRRPAAAFSPDGSRVVVFENAGQFGRSARAWIVSSASGTTVPITVSGATPSSDGADPTTSITSTTPSSSGAARGDAAVTYLWQSDDTLLAVGIAGAIYRITTSTGAATPVSKGGERTEVGVMMAALGGGTVAMVVQHASRRGSRLVTVSTSDGAVRDPAVEFDEGVRQPVLLGVSPDGTKALLSTADLAALVPGETSVYDLASGQRTAVAGTARTLAVAGAFSPDGSVVALVATGPLAVGQKMPELAADGERFHLQLAPSDGSGPPRDVAGGDDQSKGLYGPLQWSASDWIVSLAAPTGRAAAWIVNGG